MVTFKTIVLEPRIGTLVLTFNIDNKFKVLVEQVYANKLSLLTKIGKIQSN